MGASWNSFNFLDYGLLLCLERRKEHRKSCIFYWQVIISLLAVNSLAVSIW